MEQLRRALAAHFDRVITAEVAASIYAMACETPDLSIDPAQFEPFEYRGYVFAVEHLRDLVAEIHPLHVAHFAETEKYRLGFDLRPDYERMLAIERAGKLVQFTARAADTRELIGNIRMYLHHSAHTAEPGQDEPSLFASEDTFFVLKDHRKGFMALRFWQYMERGMARLGVREFHTDSKLSNKVDKLNLYCGYTAVATKFVKILKEPAHVQA